MASLKFGFIVAVAAFVSYALIGSVACKAAASESLESKLKTESTDVDVATLLRDYPDKSYEIEGHTVGQLEDICKETVSNCPISKHNDAVELEEMYKSKGYKQLSDYIHYCRFATVSEYCADNANEVGKYLLNKNLSEEDQKLVRRFMVFLKDIDTLERMRDLRRIKLSGDDEREEKKDKKINDNILKAYLKIRQKNYKKKFVNRDEDAEFRARLSNALKSFEEIHDTFVLYRDLNFGIRVDQNDDILLIEYLDLHDIAERFYSLFPKMAYLLKVRGETVEFDTLL